ncbi:hypothetical protein FRB94_003051 [Tulasnella sp. JGI-2019a]|nr:hypothetical protein FRB94_003051 [Tulasnella sp. JGI-2019a]KAG9005302.1 hypothetical protein FRB93_009856 [Tulasnella sp. JGI-2019a]KAG9034865.1 hypothetical protein FRB95_012422 [Tulasnella sp. JGI-2019a]
MRFSVVALFACVVAVIGAPVLESVEAGTNAERFARGLGPATPARLYAPDRVQAMKPRNTSYHPGGMHDDPHGDHHGDGHDGGNNNNNGHDGNGDHHN